MTHTFSPFTAARSGSDANTYPAPSVPDALDNFPGGEPNLLPIDILTADLRVEFPGWPDAPADGQEILELFWDGVKVADKSWTGAVPDDELFILLPKVNLKEGEHTLHYRVTNWQGNAGDSQPITVTIDTTAPFFPNPPGALTFNQQVQITGITRRYLDQNNNLVEARLPAYAFMPGDRAEFHWEEGGPFGGNLIMSCDLTEDTTVYFKGEDIEAEGNGSRVASFYLYDRAGNRSLLSTGRTIKVDIDPPQLREAPWVVNAQPGNPATINPINTTSGVTVRVPEQDDLPDSSMIRVHWRGFGELGSYIAAEPILVGGWDFKIPPEAIPANFKRQVEVDYSVEYPEGDSEVSEVYPLDIGAGPVTKVACAQSTGSTLSLQKVPAEGADMSLPPWGYKDKADGMRVNFWLTGIDPAGTPVTREILTGEPVEKNREPVGAKVPRGFLLDLKRNAVFRLHAAVSFDEGERYHNFQALDLNLTE